MTLLSEQAGEKWEIDKLWTLDAREDGMPGVWQEDVDSATGVKAREQGEGRTHIKSRISKAASAVFKRRSAAS